ncbi:GxxExxY protein [Phytophthora cinnamomi]|uniref:GxxExxY protein n=1 Tax=Phytophthora cinnamomi TaxID=4785 RepID=UPI00355A1C44|nr:GxxExxY protein [Phytophthora cinnamomi]
MTTHEQDETSTSSVLTEEKHRGNNQEEHEVDDSDAKIRDAIAELAENLHKISFGEPVDSTAKCVLPRITSSGQLKDELPAICNEVFRVLGPYNLEATYQRALALELRQRGVTVLSEVEIPVLYKGQRVATRRVDLYLKLHDRPVILELKAVVTGLKPEHLKQLKFYMTHFNVSDGFLINFPHLTGFPDESGVQYNEHVLQPEGGAGVGDRVTRSSTPRKDAAPKIIHVQQVKTPAKKTVKKTVTSKITGAKATKAKHAQARIEGT